MSASRSDDFAGSPIGLADQLTFTAYNVDAVVNRAKLGSTDAPKLDWSAFDYSGLDIDFALAALNDTNLGDLTDAVDVSISGAAELNVLDGLVVLKVASFQMQLGTVDVDDHNGIAFDDGRALTVTLTGVDLWVGPGGSLEDVNGDNDLTDSSTFEDNEVHSGELGFRGHVDELKIASLKDLKGNTDPADDVSYLGIQISGAAAQLVGVEEVLEFTAYDIGVLVNSVKDPNDVDAAKLNWADLEVISGIAIDMSDDLTDAVDVSISGAAELNVLDGLVVLKVASFQMQLGTVDVDDHNGIAFDDGRALTVTLTGVDLWVGPGGSLEDVNGDNDLTDSSTFEDNEVHSGELGFRGHVDELKIASLKDLKGNTDPADDVSYLGIQISGAAAQLVGVEEVLEFTAYDIGVLVNSVKDPNDVDAAKLNWADLEVISGIAIDMSDDLTDAVDVSISGAAELNVLDGLVVLKVASFQMQLGTVDVDDHNGIAFDDGRALTVTLTGVDLWVGPGGSLEDVNGDNDLTDSSTFEDNEVHSGELGFRGHVDELKIASLKDLKGNTDPADDVSYLGIQISGAAAQLVGVEEVLEFTAYDIGVLVNSVKDPNDVDAAKLNWADLEVISGIAIDMSDDLTDAVDVSISGAAELNVLDGLVVLKVASFQMQLGTVDVDDHNGIAFDDGRALTVTLTGVDLWVGPGGSLEDVNGDNDLTDSSTFEDNEVHSGELGFRGHVDELKIASLKDLKGNTDPADDVSYLGIQISGAAAQLVGVEEVLEFTAYDIGVLVNSVKDPNDVDAAKLNWADLEVISGIAIDMSDDLTDAVDVSISGAAELNVLDGLVVLKVASFQMQLGTVDVDDHNGIAFDDGRALTVTLTGVDLWVGPGGIAGCVRAMQRSERTRTTLRRHGGLGGSGLPWSRGLEQLVSLKDGADEQRCHRRRVVSGARDDRSRKLVGIHWIHIRDLTAAVKVNQVSMRYDATNDPDKLNWAD
jgi:ribosomal protein L14E/L6E/L27E